MEIVFVIVGVVALISFYDYLSAKNWQHLSSSLRNELVFKNRNKDYGAFALRRDYDRRMSGVILIVLLSVGLMSSAVLWPKKTSLNKNSVTSEFDTTMIVFPDKPINLKTEPENLNKNEGSSSQLAFIEPIVTDENSEADTSSLLINDTTNVGLVKTGGDDGFGSGLGGGDDGSHKVVEKDTVDDVPKMIVDEEARFRGNVSEFIVNTLIYPQIAIERGAQGKCYLKFVVNKDGSISDIGIERGVPDCMECDLEAKRVLRKMPNWIPGKINGRPVRTYVLLPINFSLR